MSQKNLCFRLLALLLAAFFFSPSACARSREEVREHYSALFRESGSLYDEEPVLSPPYKPGNLSSPCLQEALGQLNFLRYLAGLQPVTLSDVYGMYAQHGAVLLAANDRAEHDAPMAQGMSEDFYRTAHTGSMRSNVACLNWTTPSVLAEAVVCFVMDEGEENLALLGHRRWILNPRMAETGFGLARSASGYNYALMYAVDETAPEESWECIPWPGQGAFPAEYMNPDTPWCIVFNPEIYDLAASSITVALTETVSGASFRFDLSEDAPDGFSVLSTEAYGAGPCVIFRPNLVSAGLEDYVQNQRWQVRVEGLTRTDGRSAFLEYETQMISLTAIDPVAVEISPRSADLASGDVVALQAQVVPAYADDISVTWKTSDASVATVLSDGVVTAVGAGTCEITAESVNGRRDVCTITVK